MNTEKLLVVERVRGKRAGKKPVEAEQVPISILDVNFSGSLGQCVRARFSVNLSESQRTFVRSAIRAHECNDDVYDIRWSERNTVVIEVRRNSLARCSRIDVEKAIRRLAATIPLTHT